MKNLLYTKTWRVLVMVAVVALTMSLASCDNRKEEKSLVFDEMYAQFIAQEEFKSSSFDQQDQMLQEWLEEAENNGYIHHLDKNNAGYYTYTYANGTLGAVEIKDQSLEGTLPTN